MGKIKGKFMEKNIIVCLETSKGNIKIKLWSKIALKACENFTKLVEKKYYNGVIFHRVIKDFMIQTGDPTGTGAGGQSCWNEEFEDEVSAEVAFDKPGLVAMANAGPNTNGSQFFITTVKTSWLNMNHTIFGEVLEGYDVVKKIETVETDHNDKPKKDIKIIKAYVESVKK